MAPLTPGTDDIRTSDAAQRLWKHVEYKIAAKIEMFDFKTDLGLMSQLINKLV